MRSFPSLLVLLLWCLCAQINDKLDNTIYHLTVQSLVI